jgi:hypothetical protein
MKIPGFTPWMTVLVLGAAPMVPAFGETASSESDEWRFQFAPMFLWGISLKGSSTVGAETVPLDLNFTDNVLQNLAAVLTLHFEAHKGKWGGFGELQYVDLEPTTKIKNGPKLDLSIIDKLAEVGATYRFYGEPKRGVEVLVGVRWYSVDMDVALDIGPDLVSIDESWADGFVGGRVIWALSPKWTFEGRADIGGGPIGSSNHVWNVSAFFDYRFNDLLSGFAGYRVLDYDYSTGSGLSKFAWDVRQQGPLLGLNFHW